MVKVAKARASWDVVNSNAYTDEEKLKIIEKYETEVLKSSNQEIRSQPENKRRAIEKLNEMVFKALEIKIERLETEIPQLQKDIRFQEKKHLSFKKQLRQKPHYDE